MHCVESTARRRQSYAIARSPVSLLAISFAKQLELIAVALDRTLLDAVRHFNSPSGQSVLRSTCAITIPQRASL
jgi:hypothetical protein